ncbi:MAG: DUF4837 family protein [Bacteroidales bacterium]|nr:MAG: DUF4837 family protein [Bacteroidales bacterium]
MNKVTTLVCMLVFPGIFCCTGDKQPLLPSISGKAGDVTIVINKAEWNTEVGEEFRRIFDSSYEMLPQYEPVFDVINVTHSAFGNVFKSQRNIVITEISPSNKKPGIKVRRDVWAKPQIVIDIYAGNDDALVSLLKGNDKKIITLLDEMERKRLMDVYRRNQDQYIVQKIRKKHNVSVIIPKGYKLDVDSADFAWISVEEGEITQNILIYHYDYTDDSTFTSDYLIAKRDEFLKKYVSGTIQGSYLTTEKEFKPIFSEYSLRGERYVAELRGLWRMEEGILMGGPFVNITTLDEKRNRVVTVEGFVFAAGHKKRNFMRQIEAIVYSFDFNY